MNCPVATSVGIMLAVTCVHARCIRLDMYVISHSLYQWEGRKGYCQTFITEKLQRNCTKLELRL